MSACLTQAPIVWPGPLFLFLAALAIGLLCYIVHRWRLLSGLIAAAGCLALAWFALNTLALSTSGTDALANGGSIFAQPLSLLGRDLVPDRSFVVLGREWALTSSGLAALAFLYATAGLTFLFALPTPHGWAFYPFGVAVVGVLSLAITAQQYVYAVLFLWLAANLAAFVLAGGRPGATTGALRFLVFTTLAVMPLLILPRYLGPDAAGYVSVNGAPVARESTLETGQAAQTALLLMTLGFAILLMMVPFHGQLVAIGTYTAPMVPSFMLSTFPTVVLYVLFQLWRTHPLLLEERFTFDVCSWMGVAAVAIGGLAAIGQRRWGALVGYATLVDWGAGLIALGGGTYEGVERATLMLIWRAFSLLLVGTGWSAAFRMGTQADRGSSVIRHPGDDVERCRGLLRHRPLSVLTLLVGLFSLAGFPLTPGAAGRWPLIAEGMTEQPVVTTVLILAGVGVSVGALTSVRACADIERPADTERPLGAPEKGVGGFEAIVSAGFALFALWLVGTFLLHPNPWLELGRGLLSGLTFPEP